MFDIALYVLAVLFVLWVRAERPTPATVEVAPIEDDLPTLGELMAEAAEMTAKPAPAVAQVIAAPVVAVVKVEAEATADLASLTSAELRRRCQVAGVKWRNAHAKGRHLSKGEMIAALA